MLTSFFNFLDKHVGTLDSPVLIALVVAALLAYAIRKLAPVWQEYVKTRVERRKNGNGHAEMITRKDFEEFKNHNDSEHKTLEGKIETLQKDVGEIKESVSYIRGKLSKDA